MISNSLVSWYRENKRTLPWRGIKDPYKVWVSEIVLQQTKVDQGKSYYLKFIEKFPDVKALANANEEEVLRLWQGLGYYSRARNMHASAKEIVKMGTFPKNYDALLKLKGIGKYTASAISSFCFNESKSVVDGNVYRVLARYYGIGTYTNSSKGQKEFQLIADEILPSKNPGEHNQAIMEFGAIHCTYHNPKCNLCPLNSSCQAFLNNNISILPAKEKKTKKKVLHIHYFVLSRKEKTLFQKRSANGLWGGLFEFPSFESEVENTIDELIQVVQKIFSMSVGEFQLPTKSIDFVHQLTHRKIEAHFWQIQTESKTLISSPDLISFSDIYKYPISRLTEKYIEGGYFLDK